jgi:hypothetical protein
LSVIIVFGMSKRYMMSVKNAKASSEWTFTMGASLNPFRELVNSHEQMCEAPGRLSEWPHHIKVPHNKRPCDGDGLKHLRREVSLSSIELASLATTYDVLGVCHHCRLVKPLSESLSDKSSRTDVISACAGMDLTK